MTTTASSPPTTPSLTQQQQYDEIVYQLHIWPYVAKKRVAHGVSDHVSDHKQYRTYLIRRMNKLRARTDTKHGRGTKFTKHDLQTKIQKPLNEWKFVPDKVNFLELLLLQSERAWAQAAEYKLKNLEKDDSRMRIHAIKKLKKAAKYAQQLTDLSKVVKLDNSTLVEIDAYLLVSKANYLLEVENWEEAVKEYRLAQSIYSKLSSVAVGQEKSVYDARCAELETSIRFCNYNTGDDSAMDLPTDALESTTLSSKMNDVLQEKRRKLAESKSQIQIEDVNNNNKKISLPIESEKMRVVLVKIENLDKQLTEIANSDTFESRHLRTFDQLVFAYMEAEKLIQQDLQNPLIQQNQSSVSNLKLLATWVNRKLVAVYVKRNVWIARNTLGEKQSNFIENKNLKPYDLVKTLDTTMHRMQDSESFAKSSPYSLVYFQTLRVLFLALAYFKRAKDAECSLLIQRGQELVKQLNSTKNNDAENLGLHLLPKVETIQSELRKLAVTTRCQYAQKALNLNGPIHDDLTQQQQQQQESSYNVVQFPPSFESIACKPVFFDIAGNGIEYPEIPQEEKPSTTTTTTTPQKKSQSQQQQQQEEPKKKGWFGLW